MEAPAATKIDDIDAALARIEGGIYGSCEQCSREIEVARLRALPATAVCAECARRAEAAAAEPGEDVRVVGDGEDSPTSGRLPPDLDQLDDDEVAAHLHEMICEDGQIDTEELQIDVRRGAVYLEGAIPSQQQREILRSILTDVAGVQEIVDNLEVEWLAWERDDRSKNESAQDVTPATIPNHEPYGGTEDIVLTQEEGVTYEPPANPPAPPNRKDD